MLSPGDAALVRRDPALAGLACVLDGDLLADRLRLALTGEEIMRVRPLYARYKPATSCLVGLRIISRGDAGDDLEVDAYAKAHRRDHGGKADKALTRADPANPWSRDAVDAGDDVVVSFFPNDRKLAAGAVLSDPRRRRRLFSKLLPDRPDAWDGELHALRYKPERRYVARLDTTAGPAAVLRWYDQDDFRHAETGARAFRSGVGVRVPRLLGVSPRHRVLAIEWLSSGPSPVPLDATCPPAAFEAVGHALARLHRQPVGPLPSLTRHHEAALLASSAEAVAAVVPDLAADARCLATRLSASLRDLASIRDPIHGDFSADQVVLGDGGVGIVDYDAAAMGDPASDVGLFHANLLVDVVQGRVTRPRADRQIAALLAGYRSAARCADAAESRLGLYTAAWLLRVATEPFRYRTAAWPSTIAAILDEAAGQRP